MTTDIYKISNQKIICRVLPFYARGRKMILLLEAIASPLISLHNTFLTWAYGMLLKTKVTAQTDVLIWYLNYLFKEHFYNQNDSFSIEQDQDPEDLISFNYREIANFKMLGTKIFDVSEESDALLYSKATRDFESRMDVNSIVIHAPKLKSDANYTAINYMQEIHKVIDEYKTSFRNYAISINEN